MVSDGLDSIFQDDQLHTVTGEKQENSSGCMAVSRQLEMTGHVRLHLTRLHRRLQDSVHKYSSNYRYCCTGQTSRLGLVGGVTSKHDYSECLWHAVAAASCSKSKPKQPLSSLTLAFLDVREGAERRRGRKGRQRSFSCNIFEKKKTACPMHWSCSGLRHLD